MKPLSNKVIPFYGTQNPEMFEIERRCMDRDGLVIQFLDQILPKGWILDIGAGNGFTAQRLTKKNRMVIAMEPDPKMIDLQKNLLWSLGVAQNIPFHDQFFHGAYSTWAFFLSGIDKTEGLEEVCRIVKADGIIAIVDNYGNDEFTSLSEKTIFDDGQWYLEQGFERTILQTFFRFDSIEEAKKLLSFYFGKKKVQTITSKKIEYKVAVYTGLSKDIQSKRS